MELLIYTIVIFLIGRWSRSQVTDSQPTPRAMEEAWRAAAHNVPPPPPPRPRAANVIDIRGRLH